MAVDSGRRVCGGLGPGSGIRWLPATDVFLSSGRIDRRLVVCVTINVVRKGSGSSKSNTLRSIF